MAQQSAKKKEISYVLYNSPYFWMKKIFTEKVGGNKRCIPYLFYLYYNKKFLVCQTFILLFGNKITNRKRYSLSIHIRRNLVLAQSRLAARLI